MARENQGLKIVLIVMFVLTIILGVTTYLFSSKYLDEKAKAATLDQNLSAANREKQTLEGFNQKLKEMLFGSQEAQQWDLERVTAEYNVDMLTYAAGYGDVDESYRPVLAHLYEQINSKNAGLADAKRALQDADERYQAWRVQILAQVEEHENAEREAEGSLKNAKATYDSTLAQIRAGQSTLQTSWNAAREASESRFNQVQAKLANATEEIGRLNIRLENQGDRLEELSPETVEVPDGEIRWIDQGTGTVWISLGQADSLRRQTTFSIYPSDLTNLAKARKKGSIEVIQINGEHLAEAKILEDVISDPIIIGDKIFTPVWNPGEAVRFAMVGLMDIDGDEKSDLPLVKQLIEMSGGKVDYWVDNLGNREGQMTIATRYLVVDSESLDVRAGPGEGGQEAASVRAGVHSEVIEEARKRGIKTITLADLLRQMGWKRQSHVVRFGREADPRDFEPKPAEGVPRVSTGTVSDLFKPRQALPGELSPRGGAY
jgi:hypothetical protein